jgi:hypothetical protein
MPTKHHAMQQSASVSPIVKAGTRPPLYPTFPSSSPALQGSLDHRRDCPRRLGYWPRIGEGSALDISGNVDVWTDAEELKVTKMQYIKPTSIGDVARKIRSEHHGMLLHSAALALLLAIGVWLLSLVGIRPIALNRHAESVSAEIYLPGRPQVPLLHSQNPPLRQRFGGSLFVYSQYASKSVSQHSSSARLMHLHQQDALAKLKILHDEFSIPYSVLRYMSTTRSESLLPSSTSDPASRLLSMLKRASARRPDHTPLVLFAVIEAPTVDARIRAVASALVYAKATRRIPVLLWPMHTKAWPISYADVFDSSLMSDLAVMLDFPMSDESARIYPEVGVAGKFAFTSAASSPSLSAEGTITSLRSLSVDHLTLVMSLISPRDLRLSRNDKREEIMPNGHIRSIDRIPEYVFAPAAAMDDDEQNDDSGPAKGGERVEKDSSYSQSASNTVVSKSGTDSTSKSIDTDWADFSVVEVTDASTGSSGSRHASTFEMLGISSHSSPVSNVKHAAGASEDEDADDTFGKPSSMSMGETQQKRRASRRDDVRSLDSAAAFEAHVFVVLADEANTRYAPRSQSAAHVTSGLLKGTSLFSRTVEMAYAFEYAVASVPNISVVQRLHDVFNVPHVLLSGMTPSMSRLLLQSLLAKQATGHRSPKAIFVHAQYGLGNRLRALGSAMAFAQATNRVIVLVWVPDHHLNCLFSDLFVQQDDIVVCDGFGTVDSWPYEEARRQDPVAFNAVVWYNLMRHNGVHVHDPGSLIENDPKRHIYISTAYVIQSMVTPFIIRTRSPYWRILQTLTPNIAVASLVERLGQMPMHKMMGVHIRSKRIESDISGVGAAEYSQESSARTDYWRNLTQVETFVDEMHRQSSSQLFYVAADQVEVLDKLQATFPSRVFSTPRRCDSRDRECLTYAMADILLLSKCATIRGSYWSSFSELSVRIGGGRVLLAGIDFGTPANDSEQSMKTQAPSVENPVNRRRRKLVSRRSRRNTRVK